MPIERHTRSEEETRDVGKFLGTLVEPGDVIGLSGPLGVGKTCLVRGLAEGLGVPTHRIRSPSFTLLVTYQGGRLPLHHLDLFRLHPTADDRMALREYLYGDGVCAVEWFDHFGEDMSHLAVELRYAGTHERRICFRSSGDRYERLLEAIEADSRWR